jgi:hypothetical protein
MTSSKTAGSGTLEAYAVCYVESGPPPRTKRAVIFSGLLKVPGQAAHKESRIAGHKVNVVDAGGFVS